MGLRSYRNSVMNRRARPMHLGAVEAEELQKFSDEFYAGVIS
jgi:hypothetical protein